MILQLNEHESNSKDADIITQMQLEDLEVHTVSDDIYIREKMKNKNHRI